MRNLVWILPVTSWTPSSANLCHLCLQLCLGIDSISPRCWRRVFMLYCCWAYHSIKHRSKSPLRLSRLNSSKVVMRSLKTGLKSNQRRCQNPKAIPKRPRTKPISKHSSASAQHPSSPKPPQQSQRNRLAHPNLELWTRGTWQNKSFFSTSVQDKHRAMRVAEIYRQPEHSALPNQPTLLCGVANVSA